MDTCEEGVWGMEEAARILGLMDVWKELPGAIAV
jgi:hypothetical protein